MNLHEFYIGKAFDAYEYFGAHITKDGVLFRVYAPCAEKIELIGEFNDWDGSEDEMIQDAQSGVFECVQEDAEPGMMYKYRIYQKDGIVLDRFDPYSFGSQVRPDTASIIVDLDQYHFSDSAWIKKRCKNYDLPVNIYEVHAGSWRKNEADEENGWYHYNELARQLIPYIKEMGYTHIELMPLAEYPFDGSWGYQGIGYFAPTSRFGTPYDFMKMIDLFHLAGIGVILDWVPAHFPRDEAGLFEFDGGPSYEYSDPKKADHLTWGTRVFDYSKGEVKSFLISNALYWIEKYHVDGLRVDAVASMLYLDYDRRDGEWTPNKFGGKENLEAVQFFKDLNTAVFGRNPNTLMIAEESTSWPMVTKPASDGGLGFNFKWNMGWMNDMLKYMALDPIDRAFHHDMLTFSFFYAFSENFILPISHDEVVHGKASLINKMYGGDIDNKFKQCKLFMAYMMAHPGKKLLFMGADFAQFREWDYENGLEWFMVDEYENHRNYLNYSKNLNHFYLDHPQFWERDFSWEGFSWISNDDFKQSIIIFRRFDKNGGEVIVVCNFVPVERKSYCFGVPYWGSYTEVFNSSSVDGSPCTNGTVKAVDEKMHGFDQSVCIDIPAFSCMYFTVKKEERPVPEKKAENKKKTKTAAKKTAVKKAAKAKTTKKSTAKKAE